MASLTAVVWLALAAAAPGGVEAKLEAAIEDFEFGEHAAAADKLRGLLEPIQLEAKENVIVARQYLGACYHLLGRTSEARTQFSMLLTLDPTHRLDPAVFSPALVKLFERVRAETGLNLRDPAPPPPSPPPPPPPVAIGPPPPPPTVTTVPAPEPHSAAWSLVPFGVGQYKNRHPIKGTAFLVAEIGLFAAAAGTFAAFEGLKIEEVDGNTGEVLRVFFAEEDVDRANRLQTAYLATFWLGVATMAAGIVEALIAYPGDATGDAAADSAAPGARAAPFVFHF